MFCQTAEGDHSLVTFHFPAPCSMNLHVNEGKLWGDTEFTQTSCVFFLHVPTRMMTEMLSFLCFG